MSTNGQQSGIETKEKTKRRMGGSTAELMEMELSPAVDMRPGQYPATFIKWSDQFFFLPSKFHASGVAECMEAYFAVRNTAPDAGGAVRILRVLLPRPTSKDIHPKSKLYKILKPLAAGDEKLWDGRRDNIAQAAKLPMFAGRTCFVVIEDSKGGFANISSVNIAPIGVAAPYPSLDEGLTAIAAQASDAFDEEEHVEAPVSGKGVPF